MRDPGSVVAAILLLLGINFAWFFGGEWVARRLNFTGKWATYKGQMVIMVPIFILGWLIILSSGALR